MAFTETGDFDEARSDFKLVIDLSLYCDSLIGQKLFFLHSDCRTMCQYNESHYWKCHISADDDSWQVCHWWCKCSSGQAEEKRAGGCLFQSRGIMFSGFVRDQSDVVTVVVTDQLCDQGVFIISVQPTDLKNFKWCLSRWPSISLLISERKAVNLSFKRSSLMLLFSPKVSHRILEMLTGGWAEG